MTFNKSLRPESFPEKSAFTLEKAPNWSHLRNRYFLLVDFVLLAAIPFLALVLRVDVDAWLTKYSPTLIFYTSISLGIKIPIFYLFGLYRRFWRYASMDELVTIFAAVVLSTLLNAGLLYALQGAFIEALQMNGFLGYVVLPRSLPFIDGLLTLLAVGGSRFSVRLFEYWRMRDPRKKAGKRALIAGAGDAGELVVREMFNSKLVSLVPVGFVDDNPEKIGKVIHGVKILGPLEQIPQLVQMYRVQEVVIAMPTAPGVIIRQIVRLCDLAGVPSKSVPGIYELLSGQANLNRLRDVEIEDLLRREPVQVDVYGMQKMIAGKCVLVTGAGGSIGSELCLQIAQLAPARLVALGHGENSLFSLSNKLNQYRAGLNSKDSPDMQIVVADVRDRSRLETVFSRYTPQIVFHTAAHKHVPLMEDNVEEAVTNNVLGTWNLVELARDHGVERFVLISTDKAVNSVNVMGMTKRIAELLVYAVASETRRPYVSVRFGNVLGSRGSVVPFFRQQIETGGPVTVTHPEITRFFMTIPEAIQLVLQAATLGNNGEVFVLDMGQPVKIVDLARDLIELSGYEVERDIEIVFTGLRPGEKLYEELYNRNETPEHTRHEKVFVVRRKSSLDWDSLQSAVKELVSLAQSGDAEATRRKLEVLANSNVDDNPTQPIQSASSSRSPTSLAKNDQAGTHTTNTAGTNPPPSD